MIGIIYIAKCLSEDKVYIGQTTKDINVRKSEHLRHAKNGSKTYFHRALLLYDFNFEVLETVEGDDIFKLLNDREIYWINSFKSTNKLYGYNLSTGGRKSPNSSRKPFKHSDVTKQKIKDSVSGEKNPMFGKSIYDRWVQLYGVVEADSRMTQYISSHKLVHGGNNNGMFGRTHTDESKSMMATKAKQRVGKNANRYVEVDMLLLGLLLSVGVSKKDAAKLLNVSYFVILKRVKELDTCQLDTN